MVKDGGLSECQMFSPCQLDVNGLIAEVPNHRTRSQQEFWRAATNRHQRRYGDYPRSNGEG
jgi:hypothetical protein